LAAGKGDGVGAVKLLLAQVVVMPPLLPPVIVVGVRVGSGLPLPLRSVDPPVTVLPVELMLVIPGTEFVIDWDAAPVDPVGDAEEPKPVGAVAKLLFHG
jgi:hypothetical protein